MHDERLMRRAIEVANQNPECPFGSLLVDRETGEVVAEGVNSSNRSPVLHGEIDAIQNCAVSRPNADWSSLCLYTTAEPCCMCQGAILWAGISRVVFGTSIDTLIRLGWRQIHISAAEVVSRTPDAQCEIVSGVLERECDAPFRRVKDDVS
jgi:tRNA(Arg) A34 adenosine deaminase TadA